VTHKAAAGSAADGHDCHVHLSRAALDDGVDEVRQSPANDGTLELVVRRPAFGEREELAEATLDLELGLVGDGWSTRRSRRTDGSPHPDKQVTVMNARAALLVAGTADRRNLAGDQLYVDLDLSVDRLPVGARLSVGDDALLEITAKPHRGCQKFLDRFGPDTLAFVNSDEGIRLRLRGVYARVLEGGVIRPGDVVRRLG
jgi:MOSC domain-containing protein YiiM